MAKDWFEKPKENEVFNKYTKLNKIKVTVIAIVIFIVAFAAVYFFAKTLITYTVDIETNGGLVYGEEYQTQKYHFLEKTNYPTGLKKEGYYIEGFYEDKNFTIRYNFGKPIYRSKKLYVKWEEGYAVRLHFAEGEEAKSFAGEDSRYIFSETKLKTYYEQYVKPGSEYSMPLVFNNTEYSKHNGEQVLWFETSDCTGDFFGNKTFVVDKNIDIYGKWFDTDKSKFEISEDGTLTQYDGWCENIKLPNTVKKLKSVEPSNFVGAYWDKTKVIDGTNYSIFNRVLNTLKSVYINAECEDLGKCAFRGCRELQSVVFDDFSSLSSVGVYAFGQCSKLPQIALPETVSEIKDMAFYDTISLKKISGLNNVATVGNSAFQGSGVITLDFENLSFIGKSAFAGCINLKNLYLRSQILAKSNVTDTSSNPDTNDNILFGSERLEHIYVPYKLIDQYKSEYPTYASKFVSIEE